MQSQQPVISFQVVKLLLGFFSNTNSTREKNALNQWICEYDANMKLFEECLEITLRPLRPDPDAVGIENELREMVDLVMKQLKHTIKVEEKKILDRWMNVSEYHRVLSGEIPKHGDIEIVYKWLLTVLKKDQ